MALNSASAKWLYDLSKEHGFAGHALALGMQNLLFSKEDLQKDHNIEFPFEILNLESLFKWFGFEGVDILDVNDYEGANIIMDLNEKIDTHNSQYSFILDFGTLEHVFNVPQGLKNIHKMLKCGGYVFHLLPASNGVQHGFYQFSPTMLVDYYRANKFNIKTAQVARTVEFGDRSGYELFQYYSWNDFNPPLGGMDDGIYYSIALVQKRENSSCDVNPSQSAYKDCMWLTKSFGIKNQTVDFTPIYQLTKNIYIYGYSEYSEALCGLLGNIGVNVLGFIDSFRYGFESSIGIILPPDNEEILQQAEIRDCSILFATLNAKGLSANDRALGSFDAVCEKNNRNRPLCFSDTELQENALIGIDYKNLLAKYRTTLKGIRRDNILKVPVAKVYVGKINTVQNSRG